MNKTTLFSVGIIALSFVSLSFVTKTKAADKTIGKIKVTIKNSKTTEVVIHDHTEAAGSLSTSLLSNLQLVEKGLSNEALEVALKGYLHLQEGSNLKNDRLLSIVDFSQSSRKKRFYLIDVKNNKLLVNTYVAHGKNSGLDKAESFSNIPESEKSSLGFYVTKGTYSGKNGLSLRLAGLDKGFNDNAEKRAIVMHGADYVNEGRVYSAYMGRSQGCPALPKEDYTQVIDIIKDGSVLFVYSIDAKYLNSSELLNG